MPETKSIPYKDNSSYTLPPKRFALKVIRPGNSSALFFPCEHVKLIRSHRSISGSGGGLSLSIPKQDEYYVQEIKKGKEEKSLKLEKIENGISLPFGDIFPIRSIVFLYVGIFSENDDLFQLNIGVVTTLSKRFQADAHSTVELTISPLESILQETDFFADFQRGEGTPQNRNSDNFVGLLNSSAEVLLKGDLKSIITNFWDEFFCKLLELPRYPGTPFVSKYSEPNPDAILSLIPPESAYTENFAYESQVISSFQVGSFVSFWEILRSYASPPLYEIFIDTLETFSKSGVENVGVKKGKQAALPSEIETYFVDANGAKLVFRPTPFYMFDSDGKYRDLKEEHIEQVYEFALEDLKDIPQTESSSDFVSGVHVCLNVYSNFGTVISEPKYNAKLQNLIGPKLLSVKLGGLNFKEENLSSEKKPIYKDELGQIRDNLFSIFCNLDELKIGQGSLSLSFFPIRAGLPFSIKVDEDKKYGYNTDNLSKKGYITDVIDEFSPGEGKATTRVMYKWVPTVSTIYANL
ncbi:hypothetical protein LEP1GSC050_0009 [Leptospira phage vB_LbrZ_5399-LE1]|uniref:Uncharacterized protein n=1 Tax=Leptospira inadai serovar Lyme TaxID=293084 RepID=A0ABX4YGQ6_9LEPT|nr:hypothetical protein [Leptospira inadai]AGS80721.1 hypothetical protein LEP1GSC050_0009 [Leptospira phage vB_LbrZ_5399-LE1]AGS80810.1 hypothetical protein LEP1GSC047_0861 [Leptospira phage vB_LinZ_10-LE1]PNV74369.1 hypothetical protein BES34_014390 [Leptospira inadai serovar Lyme]